MSNSGAKRLMDKDQSELNGTRIYGYKLKVPNWKTIVQDRRRWKELVEKAKTLHESCRAIIRRREDILLR
jgi:hypothetical protein